MIEAMAISDEARRWLGVPYVHQGRSRFGVDCIGLPICVRSTIAPWPQSQTEVTNYGRRPKDGLLLDRIASHCTRIREPEEGCVILIKWPRDKDPAHCGIYSQGNIIHAYSRALCVVETGHRAHWLRDTHSYWRLPGVVI
jgi:hypothetical protein